MAYVPRLFTEYKERIAPELQKKFAYKTVMQIPQLEKIVLSRGAGKATQDKKIVESAVEQFGVITGQKAVVTNAKKDISNFKLRKGMPIGVRVTLRRDRMYDFLDRLINVAMPRIRDFRGVPANSFDGRGNYSIGVREQIIFPEIDVDKIGEISGLNITFVTSARTDEEAYALLKEFGMPFKTAAKN